MIRDQPRSSTGSWRSTARTTRHPVNHVLHVGVGWPMCAAGGDPAAVPAALVGRAGARGVRPDVLRPLRLREEHAHGPEAPEHPVRDRLGRHPRLVRCGEREISWKGRNALGRRPMMTSTVRTIIGPLDYGRIVSFDDFLAARFVEGALYELARGHVNVTEVPGLDHCFTIQRIVSLFIHHDTRASRLLQLWSSGAGCRLGVRALSSIRRPDQAIYLDPAPMRSNRVWEFWIPAIAIEVVEEESVHRDYVEKSEEYLAFGVQEYWILDPSDRSVSPPSRPWRRTAATWPWSWRAVASRSTSCARVLSTPSCKLTCASRIPRSSEPICIGGSWSVTRTVSCIRRRSRRGSPPICSRPRPTVRPSSVRRRASTVSPSG